MTQADKDLLLKDLCSRLPYGVKIDIPDLFISTKNNIEVLTEIFCGDDGEFRCNGSGMLIKHAKPYLFPLSSMTEEQYDEMEKIVSDDYLENIQMTKEIKEKVDFITHFPIYCPNVIDWFHKNHFDWRGLIEKGLAIDATNLNIY